MSAQEEKEEERERERCAKKASVDFGLFERMSLHVAAALAVALGALMFMRWNGAPRTGWLRREKRVRDFEYDYVILGGGVSGCYLAALLAAKFPSRTIVIVNREGPPPKFGPWRTYFVNLIGVGLPWLVPSTQYFLRSHKRQFANCTFLGGNSNINAAVGPLPTEKDVETCLGKSFLKSFRDFCDNGQLDRVSRPAPKALGLDRLSNDLRNAGISGGNIRVFSDGLSRLHPYDFVPTSVDIFLGEAQKLVFEECGKNKEGTSVKGVECKCGAQILAKCKTIVCCGALESPKLLLRSGIGPREMIENQLGIELVCSSEHVGQNLQDHWVGRASAVVPPKYSYPLLYPAIMGYKHRFKRVALGFGKLQLLGKNMISFATTECRNPGRIIVTALGSLEPYLPVGVDDMQGYQQDVKDVIDILGEDLGIVVKAANGMLSPNWHLSCTLGLGTVCNENFQVKGVDGLFVADVSCLKCICPMNTQMFSYIVPFCFAESCV